MKEEILVSIIVPVYNVEQYLKQCLDSLINQTYPNLEIILVNDGSTDDSLVICEQYQVKDSRVNIINKANEGHMYACRDGFRHSSGRYIMFVDSDDWIDKHTIAICMDTIRKHKSDCVLFSYIKEYTHHSFPNPLFESDYSFHEEEAADKIHRRIIGPIERELYHPHRLDNISTLWAKLYKRELVENGRFISERMIGTADDVIFNMYALGVCAKGVSYVNKCMYHYRRSIVNSITMRYKLDLPERWDILYEIMADYILTNVCSIRYQEAYYNRIACGIIGLGLNEVNSGNGIRANAKRIGEILDRERYQKALKELKIEYCNWRWKIFFWLCKRKSCMSRLLLTGLFYVMKCLRSRIPS